MPNCLEIPSSNLGQHTNSPEASHGFCPSPSQIVGRSGHGSGTALRSNVPGDCTAPSCRDAGLWTAAAYQASGCEIGPNCSSITGMCVCGGGGGAQKYYPIQIFASPQLNKQSIQLIHRYWRYYTLPSKQTATHFQRKRVAPSHIHVYAS
jgi:hypothetical protein